MTFVIVRAETLFSAAMVSSSANKKATLCCDNATKTSTGKTRRSANEGCSTHFCSSDEWNIKLYVFSFEPSFLAVYSRQATYGIAVEYAKTCTICKTC